MLKIYNYASRQSIIGVHDQLGNRATGYMVCKALEKLESNMKQAMKRFKDDRGYPIYDSLAGILNGSRKSGNNRNLSALKKNNRFIELSFLSNRGIVVRFSIYKTFTLRQFP